LLHAPSVKEPAKVTHRVLDEEEYKSFMTLESRVKVINFAGVVLQMPHPTRPVDIISEDVSEGSLVQNADFCLDDLLNGTDMARVAPPMVHDANDEDDEDDEDNNDEDNEEDDDGNEEDEEDGIEEINEEVERERDIEMAGQFSMMSLMTCTHGPSLAVSADIDSLSDDYVD